MNVHKEIVPTIHKSLKRIMSYSILSSSSTPTTPTPPTKPAETGTETTKPAPASPPQQQPATPPHTDMPTPTTTAQQQPTAPSPPPLNNKKWIVHVHGIVEIDQPEATGTEDTANTQATQQITQQMPSFAITKVYSTKQIQQQ